MKNWITHDQLFRDPSNLSVNKCVRDMELPTYMFSFALWRMLHQIVSTGGDIQLWEFWWASTMWKQHIIVLTCHQPQLWKALPSWTTLSSWHYIWLLVESPALHNEAVFQKQPCDLANDVIQGKEWNHHELRSPNQHLIQTAFHLSDSNLPRHWWQCRMLCCSSPLALYIMGHPLYPMDLMPHDNILSLTNLAGEGRMEEIKTILGWEINTRMLTLFLPESKHIAWTRDMCHLLQQSSVWAKTLEVLIGHLNHIGFTIPMMHRFLNHLHHLQWKAENN